MRTKRLDPKSGCAVELTLSVIGGVWKPLILFHLLTGKRRFMELTRLIPSATQRMLTLQLRELESDGLVFRHVFHEVPPRVEYEATPLARTLAPVLLRLRDWGERYRDEQQGLPPMEAGCSTEASSTVRSAAIAGD
ncbi:winged helix-turn-helix transcriptional regulator [Sphingomonas kyeonggiensis]|uniref:DNA-binding HxlR family transcriptional regulator n=1 Tax=Sphingomonas kyeonggiensis TaxID=1268553 RepID=A0A7W6JT50_9SPHN|nr:helix-turn-helix domain-containing protein [Sphingomonas kyeonggiensis]MBB4097967.1 DNA-binding HxlR family transcriptional regulator [Sphingomonas kyeonggiensis]